LLSQYWKTWQFDSIPKIISTCPICTHFSFINNSRYNIILLILTLEIFIFLLNKLPIRENIYLIHALYKRDFVIEKQIARHFVHYSECLSIPSHPLTFYTTQIIKTFLLQGSYSIMKKERHFSLYGEILIHLLLFL
jgi:hypothetical protein